MLPDYMMIVMAVWYFFFLRRIYKHPYKNFSLLWKVQIAIFVILLFLALLTPKGGA